MVKSDIISVVKANRLFWLGRYEERVYMTLHLLRKCYDKMIDGEPEDYEQFWHKLDPFAAYATSEDFTFGMLYDENNEYSVISELNKAKDNAILLREDITSETLSYIEMSIAYMEKCKLNRELNITMLQSITDWSMAFWGSIEQRVDNMNELSMMMVGKTVENIDMYLRFNYPFRRISSLFDRLIKYGDNVRMLIFDSLVENRLNETFTVYRYMPNAAEEDYTNDLLKDINRLVRV